MNIINTRRITQTFFFTLFVWLCFVSAIGENYWQIKNWPVNLFLNLDPLVAFSTILTTHTLYAPLALALITVIITIVFGRFFCSWLCPFGALHHFTGFLAHRKKTTAQKLKLNKYRKAQSIKYFILVFFLAAAALPSLSSTLQTGLLDPIPLITRSVNLLVLPIANKITNLVSPTPRFYEGAWLLLAVFLTAVLLNILIPRFYCRFVCPLGALFAIISRFAIWRIGKNTDPCAQCNLCDKNCEGGCEPAKNIRISECVLCFNCRSDCPTGQISYQTKTSLAGEITDPDISRRGFVLSLTSGLLAVPAVRLANELGTNYPTNLVRPPGAMPEEQFLNRCIKCGQCIRICPTNVIQPAGLEAGIENLWTPKMNNRIGSSGCQLNCVACGQLCPTAAIRPITLAEKKGTDQFADRGPVKIGTAFVDRNRCLPWAMDKPCIVCEENCPLSPKAIYTQEVFSTVRDGILKIKNINANTIEVAETLIPGKFATGDYFCLAQNGQKSKIIKNTENTLEITDQITPAAGTIEIQVRLQRPFVDIEKCTGCGVCEHECPVSGKKAIAVSPEGETRNANRKLFPGG